MKGKNAAAAGAAPARKRSVDGAAATLLKAARGVRAALAVWGGKAACI
jgi:hypothetical protein